MLQERTKMSGTSQQQRLNTRILSKSKLEIQQSSTKLVNVSTSARFLYFYQLHSYLDNGAPLRVVFVHQSNILSILFIPDPYTSYSREIYMKNYQTNKITRV